MICPRLCFVAGHGKVLVAVGGGSVEVIVIVGSGSVKFLVMANIF